jgi:hypothetical protein
VTEIPMVNTFGTTHARVWYKAWPDDGLELLAGLEEIEGYVLETVDDAWSKAAHPQPLTLSNDKDFGVLPDSRGDGPRMHWVEWVIQEFGSQEAVLLGSGESNLEAWMFINGIAPDQPFCIEFTGYFQTSFEGEYDSGWNADVVAKESWTDLQIADAWDNWIMFDVGDGWRLQSVGKFDGMTRG